MFVAWISSVVVDRGVSSACLVIFPCVQSGDTMSHCCQQFTSETRHQQYCTAVHVSVIVTCDGPHMCMCIGRRGTQWEHHVLSKIPCDCMHSADAQIQFH
jgi:hypothetical protein